MCEQTAMGVFMTGAHKQQQGNYKPCDRGFATTAPKAYMVFTLDGIVH